MTSNPLVDSCLAIVRSGYSKREQVQMSYHNAKLLMLGRWLLTGSNCPHGAKLRYEESLNSLALCFGAGIDSYCALVAALDSGFDPIYLIHVDYGHPYYSAEAEVVRNLWKDLAPDLSRFYRWQERIKLPEVTSEECPDYYRVVPEDAEGLDWENYIVPARNLLLAAIASEFSNRVWLVAHHRKDETVGTPDKTSLFYRQTAQIFTDFYGRAFSVGSPYFSTSKLEMVKSYLKRGGKVEYLKKTSSCYSPVFKDQEWLQCGTCYACYKRYQLFQALNEPFNFVTHPKDGKNFQAFQEKEAKKGR